jgi:superoxide dismutase, Cu-Zn family
MTPDMVELLFPAWAQVAIDCPGMRISAASQAWQRDSMKYRIGYMLRLAIFLSTGALPAIAADLTVTMHKATQEGTSENLGTITILNSSSGAAFKLALHGLPPGSHGFHVHENGNCGPTLLNDIRIPAGAAGGHLDPGHTGIHAGPNGEGHLGDLPVLEVEANGTAKQTLTAPRIKDTAMLKGRALVIHLGGDNYSDSPSLSGGGGGRFACGVVE